MVLSVNHVNRHYMVLSVNHVNRHYMVLSVNHVNRHYMVLSVKSTAVQIDMPEYNRETCRAI